MKATTPEGEILDIRPGANISGKRFVAIRLASRDFDDERVFEWLRETVAVRMIRVADDKPREG